MYGSTFIKQQLSEIIAISGLEREEKREDGADRLGSSAPSS
jgi:hypothetical protein